MGLRPLPGLPGGGGTSLLTAAGLGLGLALADSKLVEVSGPPSVCVACLLSCVLGICHARSRPAGSENAACSLPAQKSQPTH